MEAKQAHLWLRGKALECPCCGSPLVLTAGLDTLPDDAEENQAARTMLRIAGRLKAVGMLQLEAIEEAAERVVSGSLVGSE